MILRIKYIVFLMLISSFISAQQLPHYSLYMFNNAVINPAVCGTNDYTTRIDLMSRNQWAGFEGAPKTQLISFQRAQGENMGLGGVIFNDQTGPISRTGVQLSYAYNFLVSDSYLLSFGLSGSIYQYLFDYNKTLLHDNIFDPSAPGGTESAYVQDATFGAYLSNKKYYLGISIPQLIQSKINLNSSSEDLLVRHYFLTTGYNMELNPSLDLEPSLMIKSTDASSLQYDVNLRAIYNDKLWLGLSYRDQDALVIMAGVDYDNYSFGYSYDKTLSDIADYSDGTHGIFISYKINKKSIADNDSDGDGVVDRFDDCPKTAGDVSNNGCPVLSKVQVSIIDTAFNNLEFVFSKAEITFDSYASLERLGLMLVNNSSMRLEVEGHTDNSGGDSKNIILSKARANSVKIFLIARGIDSKRITTSFYGEDRPIAPNDTKKGRAKNRRVELKVYFD